MSILSKFLKSKAGIPEVNFEQYPIFIYFKDELIKKGASEIFKNIPTKDLKYVGYFIQSEVYRREIKDLPSAGIGVAYDVKTTQINK